jgi:hypothetical protein
MATVRHKTFIGPTWYLQGRSINDNREVIRTRAEAFIRALGPENVVSVCEHAMTFGPFSVVVWYRTEAALADDNPVVHLGNAALAAALRTKAAAGDAQVGQSGGWWVWLLVVLGACLALVSLFSN